MHLYYQDTIYDRLSDAGIDWKIYHDGVPQSIVMVRMLGHSGHERPLRPNGCIL